VDKDAAKDSKMVTAVDVGILELKTAVTNLHDQVEGITRKIEQ
jgi:hypothetical protein